MRIVFWDVPFLAPRSKMQDICGPSEHGLTRSIFATGGGRLSSKGFLWSVHRSPAYLVLEDTAKRYLYGHEQ